MAFAWQRSPSPTPCVLSHEGSSPPSVASAPARSSPTQTEAGAEAEGRSQEAAETAARAGGRGAREGPTPTLGWALFPHPARPGDFSDAGPLSPGVRPVFSEVPAPSQPLMLFTVLHLTAGRGKQCPAGRGRN